MLQANLNQGNRLNTQAAKQECQGWSRTGAIATTLASSPELKHLEERAG